MQPAHVPICPRCRLSAAGINHALHRESARLRGRFPLPDDERLECEAFIEYLSECLRDIRALPMQSRR